MKDLVVLVPDKNVEHTVKGLLGRPRDLGLRDVEYDIFVHPRRDPGCLLGAHEFLRPFHSDYRFALVMFDHQGSGQEREPPSTLVDRVRLQLERNGWLSRAEVVVLAPELEVWVWSDSPQVDDCLGWAGRQPSLREWLAAKDYWPPDAPKPADPKTATEEALREVRKPRSSAIYLALAQQVSLCGHTEPAFLHFTQTLQRWFSS